MSLNHVRRGAGEPLVLVHGIGSQWRIWEPVLDTLAADFDVIAIDLPGFGRTPHDGTGPGVEAQAERVAQFFRDLDLGLPHVAGNSMGGAIALELARTGAVATATAVSPAGFWTPRERVFCQQSLQLSRRLLAAIAPVVPALVRSPVGRTSLMSQLVARPWRMDGEAAIDHLAVLTDAPAFDACCAAFADYTFHDAEELRGVPVTIAWGDYDFLLLSRQRDRARKVMPWAHHVPLAGCGHAPFSDDPALLASVIAAGARARVPVAA
ncbi:MAG: alpha/beta hydrolase [Solirubrobacterales bacterium]|nr:alpha/beta hydrolase [Solirubrobacterales bacterium]